MGSLKNILGEKGGGSRKTNIEGKIPKKGGAWTVCKFKGGLGKKERGGVFEEGRGWYPNTHYKLRLKLTTQQSALLVAEY